MAPARTRVTLDLPSVLVATAKDNAGQQGVSLTEYVSAALASFASRGQDATGLREVVAFRIPGSPWAAMEHILARRVRVEDLVEGQSVRPDLVRALRAAGATETQLRRVLPLLRGQSMREVAEREGTCHQAIAQSTNRLYEKLRNSPAFGRWLQTHAQRLHRQENPDEPFIEREHRGGE